MLSQLSNWDSASRGQTGKNKMTDRQTNRERKTDRHKPTDRILTGRQNEIPTYQNE